MTSTPESLIPQDMLDNIDIDFTMMNPPFYSSTEELLASAAAKSRPPNSACTGAETEMIYLPPATGGGDDYPGGELGFTLRLLQQSRLSEVGGKIQWFTTMLGKLSTASQLVDRIRAMGCTNYAITEFVQGSKTRRWGVAWSWYLLRPANSIARGTEALGKAILPAKTELVFSQPEGRGVDEFATRIDRLMETLDGIDWIWKPEISTGVGKAPGNVWGRRARRQKLRRADQDTNSATADLEAFVFKLSLRVPVSSDDRTRLTEVHVRWLRGSDVVVFESFCEMVRRHMQQE